jgi:gentisate 1,2-dioxygenase
MSTPTTVPSEDERLTRLDERLAALHLIGHWHGIERAGGEPRPVAPPYLWRWADIRGGLLEAGELRGIDGSAGRRTVRLCTPGLAETATTRTIHASVQLVKPGEVAPAHRHSLGALRFVVEGSDGYTTVEGAKLAMEPGDLILTPQWTWHDHGHDGATPMIWIDGHDVPFTSHLNGIFFENYPQRQQPVISTGPHPYVFKGAEARAQLNALPADAFDPSFGMTLVYTDPRTGESTLPTMTCRLSRLAAGQETARTRRTANVIYHVVAGSGTTRAGDTELHWGPGDLFVVPGWTWQQHRAEHGEATLFSMSDEPIMSAYGLLRVQTEER